MNPPGLAMVNPSSSTRNLTEPIRDIIAMAKSVNHCLTECPSIEVWQIDTNQAAHDFVAGIPRLHQLAYTIKHTPPKATRTDPY